LIKNVESNKRKKTKNKLPGISNWFEWSWPIRVKYAGCIKARDIANIGTWTTFFPRDLEKLQMKMFEKPNPDISTPSIPENPWTISLPNVTGLYVWTGFVITSKAINPKMQYRDPRKKAEKRGHKRTIRNS